MAKPKERTVYYAISRAQVNDAPAAAMLDMLRYDGARVESNSPNGYWLFSITRTDGSWPKVHSDRWRSFGLTIAGESVCRIELHDWLEGHKAVKSGS